jgi:hypothetical protein
LGLALAPNPNGSKTPTGARAPGMVSRLKVDTGAEATGAAFLAPKELKAEAEEARRAREAAIFISLVFVWL